MTRIETNFEQLPASIPIFPLSGILLLPRGLLPLNIFEPRYRNMTQDAMSSDRLIGMVQPVGPEEVPITPDGRIKNLNGERINLYSTGCAGYISQCRETPDGRFLLALTGVFRFKIGDEVETDRGYRRFTVDWSMFRDDASPPTTALDRSRLLAAMHQYFEQKKLNIDWNVVDEAEDETLINTLAMSSPFSPAEKQALLEAGSLAERCDVLASIAEMATHDHNISPERPQ